MREIQEHKIKIYEFPETDDEEENKLVKKIKVRVLSLLPLFVYFRKQVIGRVYSACGEKSCIRVEVLSVCVFACVGSTSSGCSRQQHHHRSEREEG